MDLNTLIIIDKISSLGTFSAAAKALKMPNSNLSLKVKQLEEALGQPLFARTTRHVAVTEFGRQILEEAAPLFGVKHRIEALAEEANQEPSGELRVSTPHDLGLYMLRSIIPSFVATYSKITVNIDLNNAYVDIVPGGFDLVIRAAVNRLPDSSVIAVKLGETILGLYAHKDSPYAGIKTVDQLHHQPLISMGDKVKLTKDGETRTFPAQSQIIVKDMTGIKNAALGQAGIGVIPNFIGSDEHSQKALTQILPAWSAGRGFFYGLYPQKDSLTPKSRVFLEYLRKNFKIGPETDQSL